jgi:hypothetical protein
LGSSNDVNNLGKIITINDQFNGPSNIEDIYNVSDILTSGRDVNGFAALNAELSFSQRGTSPIDMITTNNYASQFDLPDMSFFDKFHIDFEGDNYVNVTIDNYTKIVQTPIPGTILLIITGLLFFGFKNSSPSKKVHLSI